jgi:hypothetical protein
MDPPSSFIFENIPPTFATSSFVKTKHFFQGKAKHQKSFVKRVIKEGNQIQGRQCRNCFSNQLLSPNASSKWKRFLKHKEVANAPGLAFVYR